VSNSFLIPFDNNPVSTEVKTGAYTIPVGKYAKVTVADFSDDFEIDSVIAFYGTASRSSIDTTTTGTRYTNNTPYTMRGSLKQSSGAVVELGVFASGDTSYTQPLFNLTGTAHDSVQISLAPNDFIRVTAASGGSSGANYSLSADTIPSSQVFWVPSSTDLDGTRYVVELFNNIS
jgi:hypothetical protein